MDNALRQLGRWHAAGIDLSLSINVSATNLEEIDLAQRVGLVLLKHSISNRRLEIEITESAVMQKGGLALSNLNALNAAGIRLAIDDFGTGHSSLGYCSIYPVHVLKIDRSFTAARWQRRRSQPG